MVSNYKWNIGNKLAQVKYCKTEQELEQFISDLNLRTEYKLIYPKNHFMRVDASYEDNDVEIKIEVHSKRIF